MFLSYLFYQINFHSIGSLYPKLIHAVIEQKKLIFSEKPNKLNIPKIE